jgi:hypothetical protein
VDTMNRIYWILSLEYAPPVTRLGIEPRTY